jgi:hypothetical protein
MEQASFEPWSVWPSGGTLGPTYETFKSGDGYQLDAEYLVAPSFGDHLAVLVSWTLGPAVEKGGSSPSRTRPPRRISAAASQTLAQRRASTSSSSDRTERPRSS